MKPSKMKLQRVKFGISQVELSEITGLSQAKISLIERGLQPSKKEARIIAFELGLTADKLFKTITK